MRHVAEVKGGTPPELRWTASGALLREASAPGGRYVLISNGMAEWSAQWRPIPEKSKGKPKAKVDHLAFRTSETAARLACQEHQFEQHTNRLLAASGDEELARPDLAGAPITWKGPRYRP